MKDESERTFLRLKRTPLAEMKILMEKIPRLSPLMSFGGSGVVETADTHPEIIRLYERIKLLKDNGWEFEDYALELEKEGLLREMDMFNKNDQFPNEHVQRLKRFFPNSTYHPARIDFGDE